MKNYKTFSKFYLFTLFSNSYSFLSYSLLHTKLNFKQNIFLIHVFRHKRIHTRESYSPEKFLQKKMGKNISRAFIIRTFYYLKHNFRVIKEKIQKIGRQDFFYPLTSQTSEPAVCSTPRRPAQVSQGIAHALYTSFLDWNHTQFQCLLSQPPSKALVINTPEVCCET